MVHSVECDIKLYSLSMSAAKWKYCSPLCWYECGSWCKPYIVQVQVCNVMHCAGARGLSHAMWQLSV